MTSRIALVLWAFLFIPFLSYTQDLSSHPWQHFIQTNTKTKPFTHDAYLLVKLAPNAKTADLLQRNWQVVRKLDAQHVIVKANRDVTAHSIIEESYLANNQWKLALGVKAGKMHYALKVTDIDAFTSAVERQALPIVIHDTRLTTSVVVIKAESTVILARLLDMEEVIFIDKYTTERPLEESRVLGMDLSVNQITTLQHHVPELDGTGMLISINERQFITDDIDLINREVPSGLATDETSSHATDMATTAAGAGNSSLNGRGIAWAANLSSTDNVDRFPDDATYYTSFNVFTQNHSWGEAFVQNDHYGTIAEAYDQSANDNPQLLHVFSVGNSGLSEGEMGTYAGIENFANITGEYKMAKNMLVVGALDWELNPLSFVSNGPAYDGRVKPELCAYNVNGSSGAAATVSGVATLLQQAYKLKHGNALPASALLKAMLINSADDAGLPGLDFTTGYGNVNAWKAYQALNDETYFTGSVAQGESATFELNVPANVKNLKMTLVWNDPAAMPNANTALVNDLDMVLTSPTAGDFLPWVLNSSPHVDSLTKAAERKEDHLNTIEQITIENPESGRYQLNVSGFDIPSGNQSFFVVYEWEFVNRFEWLYPTGGDNVPYLGEGTAASEDASYFRWDATYDHGTTGLLEYSTDHGQTWVQIDDAVDLSTGLLFWEAPDTFALGVARMTINSNEYVTDEFVFSREFRTRVGFNCDDSIQLNWPFEEGATRYKLLRLGNQYMEEVLETTDTFTVLNTISNPDVIYGVEPFFANGKSGVRSPSFDYTLQGAGCYLNSFFPLLAEDGRSIALNLDVGTFYGVSQITFERKSGEDSEFERIITRTAFSTNPMVEQDIPSIAGLQVYRVRISLANGGEVVSDPTSIFFLSDNLPVLVFPNPVNQGGDLAIFTKTLIDSQATLQIYDQAGRLLKEKRLLSDREFLSVASVEAGVYIYRITIDGETKIGRLVVQ
ncbi:MAG: S8 family peptidase [Flammeovirgaceae bacterium]